MKRAILDGASQIAVPAVVSTLCICIVFVPMFLLTGVARYLFVPLAKAVVFAMLASYFLSGTLIPTLVMYIMRGHEHRAAGPKTIFGRYQRGFERGFDKFRHSLPPGRRACGRGWQRHARAWFRLARVASAGLFPQPSTDPNASRNRYSRHRPEVVSLGRPLTQSTYEIPFLLSYEPDLFGKYRRTLEASNATLQATAADMYPFH